MKIGIFGDSFADRHLTQSWWNLLQTRHGHQVRSFGEDASSIFFSARILDIYANQFDLVIWALTESDRHTVMLDRDFLHLGPGGYKSSNPDADRTVMKRLHTIYQQHLKYIFDRGETNFVATNIIENLRNRHTNVLILPCFFNPLHQDFCLYKISEKESNHYLGIQDLAQIWRRHEDLRQGHLLPRNHEILCDLLQDNLEPGIFQADLDLFVAEDGPVHQYFQPR